MKRTLFLGAVTLTAILLIAGCQPRKAAPGTLGINDYKGRPAPAFNLQGLDGQPVALDSYKGKAVLVNYWATWCPPCQAETPWLTELQKQYGPRGLQVVGISMDDPGSEATVRGFLQKKGVNYPVAMGNEDLAGKYGSIDTLPVSFLIDRQGNVVDRINGADKGRLSEAVEALVAGGK